ncbi:MAG: hypothetical protein KatS3mg056_1452 [Chloroflexus sp.]|nr:MAG: hypothetical protein KatS3mg056_1452 [Chloroflexus sp.]
MIDIKMPQLGESVTEGTVGRWLKRPGDPVAKYEPLLEVVTDKVDTEVPAPEAGVLHEILVPEGETVRVGTVIARLAPAGATVPATPASAPAATTVATTASATTTVTATVAPPVADGRNTYLSPVVARLLSEHNLDPGQIRGTGQGGRITKQDVLRFLAERQQQPPAPVTAPVAPRACRAPAGTNTSSGPGTSPGTDPGTTPHRPRTGTRSIFLRTRNWCHSPRCDAVLPNIWYVRCAPHPT